MLTESHDVDVPENQHYIGQVGTLLFFVGAFDLIADTYLCLSLISCGSKTLLCFSAVTTMVLSSATTWYLGFQCLLHKKY